MKVHWERFRVRVATITVLWSFWVNPVRAQITCAQADAFLASIEKVWPTECLTLCNAHQQSQRLIAACDKANDVERGQKLSVRLDDIRIWLQTRKCNCSIDYPLLELKRKLAAADTIEAVAATWALASPSNRIALKSSTVQKLTDLGKCSALHETVQELVRKIEGKSTTAGAVLQIHEVLLLCPNTGNAAQELDNLRKTATSLIKKGQTAVIKPPDLNPAYESAIKAVDALRKCRERALPIPGAVESSSLLHSAQSSKNDELPNSLCEDEERWELHAVTTYLIALHLAKLPPSEVPRATKLLFGVGIDQVEVSELQRALGAWWLKDSETREFLEKLAKDDKIRDLAIAAKGKSIEALKAMIDRLPADEQREFLLVTGAIFMAHLRGEASREREERLLDIVITPVPSHRCEQDEHFLSYVEAAFAPTASRMSPIYVSPSEYSKKLRETIESRRRSCGGTQDGEGCGVVLGINLEHDVPSLERGRAELTFVVPERESHRFDHPLQPISIQSFKLGCQNKSDQIAAGKKLVADVLGGMNILYSLPGTIDVGPARPGPASECGISIGRIPHGMLALQPRAGVAAESGSADTRTFESALRVGLQDYGAWTGGWMMQSEAAHLIKFERETADRDVKLSAHVFVRSGDAWNPAFSVWARLVAGSCEGDEEQRMSRAGRLVAQQIGNVFFGSTIGRISPPLPRPPPPLWHAFLLAGTRQMEHYGPSSKWKYGALADAILVVGGASLILASVPLENRAVNHGGSTPAANRMLGVGIGSIAAALGIRLWGLFDSLGIEPNASESDIRQP